MKDYKDTLNLPKTAFPMKANLAQREPQMLAQWQEQGIYQQLRIQRKGKEKFILHDGPPYANGEIHIGHSVNKILKDIIVKSKNMEGLDSPYIPGWDCHGLPIELQVEKKLGKPGQKVSLEEFRKACREYATKQVNCQRQDFIRLGIMADWQDPYLTMDFKFEANIVRSLAKIIHKGHVVQGFKPVHWCLDCASALAEAEVEYADKTSQSIDVRFKLVDQAAFLEKCSADGEGDISVVIWTTTPWTLPANQAVSLHPDFDYVLVQLPGERLVLAQSLAEDCLARYGHDGVKTLASCKGRDLEGLLLQHPFYDRQVPLILGDHVTVESGTGAVHTAPGHGQEDYVVGQRYDLAVDNPVAANGCFYADTPLLGGQHVFKADALVIDILTERQALLNHQKLQHSYPHCWRHKSPVIFRATPQWFISMNQQGLRQDSLKAIKEVQWMPDWGEQRIYGMVENRPDWCISRQRSWGAPIPLFVHEKTAELHPNSAELLEQVATRIEEKGVDAWFSLAKEELLGEEADNYIKVMDTLDVWFDSGVTHECVLEDRENLQVPADLYLEGSDQHRGWFQSSLLSSMAIRKKPPYKQVLTHGFVVDAKGKKMSKSLGNVVAPQKVMKSLGADILRLWVAATDYRGELTVSDEILKRVADSYRRMRNTLRFLLANLDGFDPNDHRVDSVDMEELDQALLARVNELQAEIQQAYHEYEFHHVYQKLHRFCTVDLGGFYLDILKDRIYTTPTNSRIRRSGQTAMYHAAHAMVRWMTPVLSFTAHEIWQHLPGTQSESVFYETWYELPKLQQQENYLQTWHSLIALKEIVGPAMEAQREAGVIGSSLDGEIDLYGPADDPFFQQLQHMGDELRFVLISSEARLHSLDEKPVNTVMLEEVVKKIALAKVDKSWGVTVNKSEHNKCVRCWHLRPDVGEHSEHPELCGRCVENIA